MTFAAAETSGIAGGTEHPLFVSLDDQLRSVVVAWDALKLAPSSTKPDRAARLSDRVRVLMQKLEYDRSCAQMVRWSGTHVVAQKIANAWMRCMMNGTRMTDDEVLELGEEIDRARDHLNTPNRHPNS